MGNGRVRHGELRLSKSRWTEHEKPRCFDSMEDWREWLEVRSGAWSPCQDCTPSYRATMRDALRCDRPEVIFIEDRATREVEGVTVDDPRFARLLAGLPVGRNWQVMGRTIERTPAWTRLMEIASKRAHLDVKRAYRIWLKGVGNDDGGS